MVRAAVVTLDDIANRYGSLMEKEAKPATLASSLVCAEGAGTLFIFDNFETIADPRSLHEFLDTHTHLPNKVLITSRERAFKADYPIEVKGMEWPEAEVVMLQAARRLNVEGMTNQDTLQKIFEHTEGHPYLMQIVMGETAAAGRYVSTRTVLGRRADILEAVFERSFGKLTPGGRWCFLVVANWRAPVPGLGLYAVGIERGKDIEIGIDECLRMSLITEADMADGQACYEAPQVARNFGKKKLVGDPDRIEIQADLELLRSFGVIKGDTKQTNLSLVLRGFFEKSRDPSMADTAASLGQMDRLLTRIAERWPPGWRHLAEFRHRAGMSYSDVDAAARRAVEEAPHDTTMWRQRADYAKRHGDRQTEMACWVSAVEAEPTDTGLVNEAANCLNNYASDIPVERRGYYLASVRGRMEQVAKKLDATGRSRLAWLYLHEGNDAKAREHMEAGLKIDGDNIHCRKLWDRLEASSPSYGGGGER